MVIMYLKNFYFFYFSLLVKQFNYCDYSFYQRKKIIINKIFTMVLK